MGILATNNRQLIYIYTSESNFGKEMLGYVQCLNKKIQTIDINNELISETIWLEIADKIGKPLGEIFALNHPDTINVGNANDFLVSDWLKIIKHNSSLMQNPIVINGNEATLIKEKSDMMKIFEREGN